VPPAVQLHLPFERGVALRSLSCLLLALLSVVLEALAQLRLQQTLAVQ